MAKVMLKECCCFLMGFLILLYLECFVLGFEVEQLQGTYAEVADGPHWRYPNLYYADLATGGILRYDSLAGKTYRCQIANSTRVTFIISYRKSHNLFVIGLRKYVVQIYWDGISATHCPIRRQLFQVEAANPQDANNCLNDAKCDAAGRLLTGTVNCDSDFRRLRQNLYSYASGKLEVIKTHLNFSNGMAWNDKLMEYYHVDSGAHTITRFKYDLYTGMAVEPTVVFTLDTTEYPDNAAKIVIMDGMTIDTEGNLYVAIFGGKVVLKICTSKWQIIERLEMPCTFVTSVAFGGPKLDILYVTTMGRLSQFPSPCGSVFRVHNLKAQGLKMNDMGT